MDNQEYLIQHWSELTDEERRSLFGAAEDAGEFEEPETDALLTCWHTVFDRTAKCANLDDHNYYDGEYGGRH